MEDAYGCSLPHPALEMLGPMHERDAKKTNFHPVKTRINNDEELFPAGIQSTAMTGYPIYKGENRCGPE